MKRLVLLLPLAMAMATSVALATSAAPETDGGGHVIGAGESRLATPQRGCPDSLQWKIGYDHGDGFLSTFDMSNTIKGSVASKCSIKPSMVAGLERYKAETLLKTQWIEARKTALDIYRRSVNAALCLNRAQGCKLPESSGIGSTAYGRIQSVVEDGLRMAPELDFSDRVFSDQDATGASLEGPFKDTLTYAQCKQTKRIEAADFNREFVDKASFYVGMATLALGPGTALARGLVRGSAAVVKMGARAALGAEASGAVAARYTGMQIRAARMLAQAENAAPRAAALASRMGTAISKVPGALFRYSDMADLALTAPSLVSTIQSCSEKTAPRIKEPPDWAPGCALKRVGEYHNAVTPSEAAMTNAECITSIGLGSIGLFPMATMLK